MNSNMKKSFGMSAAIHLLLLAALMLGQALSTGGPGTEKEESEEKGGGIPPMDVEIVSPPSDKESEVTLEDSGDLEKAPHAKDDCDDFYGGIGIIQTMNVSGVFIMEVPYGYPAYNAGLQVGDQLLNSEEIRGPIGTPVTVITVRSGVTRTYNLIRDKICTTPPKNQGANP